MRGYMTMIQAFECGPNDIPFIDGGFNSHSKFSKKKLKESHIATQYVAEMVEVGLSDKWQVHTADRKPKTRDEMKEFFTEAFKDAPFMTADIIDSIADIFTPLSEKLGWGKIDKVKEAISQFEIEKQKPAPESEKVLTVDDHLAKQTGLFYLKSDHEREIAIEWFRAGYGNGKPEGRLERDLELREAISDLERLVSSIRTARKGNIHGMNNVYCDIKFMVKIIDEIHEKLQNLPPLKAE